VYYINTNVWNFYENLIVEGLRIVIYQVLDMFWIVKPWLWRFLFIVIEMICFMTNSISYGCITRSGLFEFSINEWMKGGGEVIFTCRELGYDCHMYHTCKSNNFN